MLALFSDNPTATYGAARLSQTYGFSKSQFEQLTSILRIRGLFVKFTHHEDGYAMYHLYMKLMNGSKLYLSHYKIMDALNAIKPPIKGEKLYVGSLANFLAKKDEQKLIIALEHSTELSFQDLRATVMNNSYRRIYAETQFYQYAILSMPTGTSL